MQSITGEGDCYIVSVGHLRDDGWTTVYVSLLFQAARRPEVEWLPEGQGITYEGQIRWVDESRLSLVRITLEPDADASVGSREDRVP